MGVEGDQLGAVRDRFAILQIDRHAVVAVLAELIQRLLVEPLCPVLLEMVNFVVSVRLIEVFDLLDPGVVIALDGEDRDILVVESLLDHVSHHDGVDGGLVCRIVPDVVSSIIAGPEHQIWLNIFTHVVDHSLE